MSSVLAGEPVPYPYCSDCDCLVTNMGPDAIAKGSSVREPGEALCASCSAMRCKMVRELNALPNNLGQIRARRIAR